MNTKTRGWRSQFDSGKRPTAAVAANLDGSSVSLAWWSVKLPPVLVFGVPFLSLSLSLFLSRSRPSARWPQWGPSNRELSSIIACLTHMNYCSYFLLRLLLLLEQLTTTTTTAASVKVKLVLANESEKEEEEEEEQRWQQQQQQQQKKEARQRFNVSINHFAWCFDYFRCWISHKVANQTPVEAAHNLGCLLIPFSVVAASAS